MPMVWYIPPLSPVVDVVRDTGYDAEDRGNLFAAIDALRIPVDYLAQLFTAGDPAPVDAVLRRLAAMRSYMRDLNLGRDADESIPAAVGMTGEQMYDMYRLLALAKYDERYVIPPAHAEQAHHAGGTRHRVQPGLRGRPRHGRLRPVRRVLRRRRPRSRWRTSTCCASARPPTPPSTRRTRPAASTCSTGTARAAPTGLFPPDRTEPGGATRPPTPATPTEPAVRQTDERRDPARSPGRSRRCCSATPTRSCWPAPAGPAGPSADAARSASARRCGASSTTSDATPLPRPGRRLRRHLRPPQTVLPVPDLLRARRHPQTGHGPAAAQADLRRGRPRASSTTNCPTTSPSCWSSPPPAPRGGAAAAAGAPGRPGAAPPGPADAGSPWADVLDSVSATLPPLTGDDSDAVARLAAAGPARGAGRPRPVRAAELGPSCPTGPEHAMTAAARPRASGGEPASTILLWVVLPYVAITVFVVGHIWRYRYDKFGWTTRSSQLYERRLLRIGSPLFHFGILLVLLGHVGGLLIPSRWTEAAGISETAYHAVAVTSAPSPGSAPSPAWRSSSTAAAPSARSSPPPPATTRSMYVLLVGDHRARARHHRARQPHRRPHDYRRDRLARGSGPSSTSSPTPT